MQEPAKAAVEEAAKDAEEAAEAEGPSKGTKRPADQDAQAENGPAALKIAPDTKRRKTDSDWGILALTSSVPYLPLHPTVFVVPYVLSHTVWQHEPPSKADRRKF